jgi:hypothetical protein
VVNDRSIGTIGDRDPIADHGTIRPLELEAHPSGGFAELGSAAEQLEDAAAVRSNARRDKSRPLQSIEVVGKKGVETEIDK